MLSAATARGLGPCGPRRRLGRRSCPAPQPHHQRIARHHAGRPTAETPTPRPSLLTTSDIPLSGRAAVITDRGALRPLAPAARPHGGTSRPSGGVHLLWRTSPVTDARGTTQTAASAAGQAASQQQEVAARAGAAVALPDSGATDRTGGSGATRTPSSPALSSVPASAPSNSAGVAARLLRGALEAALLPRLEAIEGRVGAMEAKVVESMEAMEGRMMQRMEKQVQQKEVGAGERQLTAAPEAVVAVMRAQKQELAKEHGQEEAPVREQEQAPEIALAAMEQRIREELKVRSVGCRLWVVGCGACLLLGDGAVESGVGEDVQAGSGPARHARILYSCLGVH